MPIVPTMKGNFNTVGIKAELLVFINFTFLIPQLRYDNQAFLRIILASATTVLSLVHITGLRSMDSTSARRS